MLVAEGFRHACLAGQLICGHIHHICLARTIKQRMHEAHREKTCSLKQTQVAVVTTLAALLISHLDKSSDTPSFTTHSCQIHAVCSSHVPQPTMFDDYSAPNV